MQNSALEITGLHSGYGDIEVLRGVDLKLPPRSIVALVGSNGAGKTTLLKTVSGMLKAQEGQIALDGGDVTNLKPHKVVEAGFVQSPEGKLPAFEDVDANDFSCCHNACCPWC